jgi:hypothetical protein
MQPYIYVCEMIWCKEPATKRDVEDWNYLCEDHFVSVVKGII